VKTAGDIDKYAYSPNQSKW